MAAPQPQPAGKGQPQMVLCSMVINPDGSCSYNGPLDRMPGGPVMPGGPNGGVAVVNGMQMGVPMPQPGKGGPGGPGGAPPGSFGGPMQMAPGQGCQGPQPGQFGPMGMKGGPMGGPMGPGGPKGGMKGKQGMMPDPRTMAQWGLATMGKANGQMGPGQMPKGGPYQQMPGPDGMGGPQQMWGPNGPQQHMVGMQMLPPIPGQGMGPMPGMMMMMGKPGDFGKGKGKGSRPVDLTSDQDWERLGAHRAQGGDAQFPDLNSIVERSAGTDNGFFRGNSGPMGGHMGGQRRAMSAERINYSSGMGMMGMPDGQQRPSSAERSDNWRRSNSLERAGPGARPSSVERADGVHVPRIEAFGNADFFAASNNPKSFFNKPAAEWGGGAGFNSDVGKGGGKSSYRRSASAERINPKAGRVERYTGLFAQPTSEGDWKSLGANRGSKEGGAKPKLVDSTEDAQEDEEWAKMFDGDTKPSSKVLQLKGDKPAGALDLEPEKNGDKDWAIPVPDEELKWHAEAAKSAKKAFDRIGTQDSEEHRSQQAEEAREQRRRELQDIDRQRQQDAARRKAAEEKRAEGTEGKDSTEPYKPPAGKYSNAETRTLEAQAAGGSAARSGSWGPKPRNGGGAAPEVDLTGLDPEEYREKQAEVARKQRERELQEIEKQKQRDEAREAKKSNAGAAAQPSKPYVPKSGSFKLSMEDDADPASVDAEAHREKQALEARKLREQELQQQKKQTERFAEQEAKRGGDSSEGQPRQAYAPPGAQDRKPSPEDRAEGAEEYREKQAKEAREQRELELRMLEVSKQRAAELEAKRLAKAEAAAEAA